MQALCQWEVQGDESHEALIEFILAQPEGAASIGYATDLVLAYWRMRDDVDARLNAALTKWSLSRLSPVERNVLRVGLVELLEAMVPPRVAVNEAIEIGRAYGGGDTPRFVNGVLDAVLRELPAANEE
jgi:N utilization substance protein B